MAKRAAAPGPRAGPRPVRADGPRPPGAPTERAPGPPRPPRPPQSPGWARRRVAAGTQTPFRVRRRSAARARARFLSQSSCSTIRSLRAPSTTVSARIASATSLRVHRQPLAWTTSTSRFTRSTRALPSARHMGGWHLRSPKASSMEMRIVINLIATPAGRGSWLASWRAGPPRRRGATGS